MTERAPQLLSEIELFSELNEAELNEVAGLAQTRSLPQPSMRAAFRENVRFDAPAMAQVEEGLPLGSLEISAPERFGLRIMPWLE